MLKFVFESNSEHFPGIDILIVSLAPFYVWNFTICHVCLFVLHYFLYIIVIANSDGAGNDIYFHYYYYYYYYHSVGVAAS